MPKKIADFSAAEYASFINEQSAAVSVDPASVDLMVPGAHAMVRLHGGHLLRGSLTSHRSGLQTDVFYAGRSKDSLLHVPLNSLVKLRASHVMVPVGAYDGPGGQHGPYRHGPWEMVVGDRQSAYEANAGIRAATPRSEPVISRGFILRKGELTIATQLINQGRTGLYTSLGHHDYYVAPQNEAMSAQGQGPLVNGLPLDQLLQQHDAWRWARTGRAQLWRRYEGGATVAFPQGNELYIRSRLEIDHRDRTDLLAMQFWAEPNEAGYLAAEVVAGVAPEAEVPDGRHNRQLHLAAGSMAMLSVTTTLL